ncbi:hypothetical protein M758_1G186100 [Ceratodon purpureus]|nr:hypothetical protein M758_1G186100 [Ceratodon purpureus]
MELGLEFPCKGYVCSKPGAFLSLRNSPGTFCFAAVSSSSALINTSSNREGLGTTSLRGRQLARWHSQSSCSRLLVRENLNVPQKFLDYNRCAAGRNVGLSADAKMEAEDEDEAETEITEPTTYVSENVSEFRLSGDETELQEIGTSLFSIQTAEKVMVKIGDVGKQFVMNNVAGVVGILKMGQKQPEPEVLELHTASIEKEDGVTAVYQWSATELTMQHDQLARIAIDINYLVFAFAFFGWVRILEAILAVFSTSPPVFRRMLQSFSALDYLTIAWLAHNLRKPIIDILQVDPTDLQRVAMLKTKVWEELHAFFERQWKVMATVAVARFLGVIASYIPPSQWMTKPMKIVWDTLMALPAIF